MCTASVSSEQRKKEEEKPSKTVRKWIHFVKYKVQCGREIQLTHKRKETMLQSNEWNSFIHETCFHQTFLSLSLTLSILTGVNHSPRPFDILLNDWKKAWANHLTRCEWEKGEIGKWDEQRERKLTDSSNERRCTLFHLHFTVTHFTSCKLMTHCARDSLTHTRQYLSL